MNMKKADIPKQLCKKNALAIIFLAILLTTLHLSHFSAYKLLKFSVNLHRIMC